MCGKPLKSTEKVIYFPPPFLIIIHVFILVLVTSLFLTITTLIGTGRNTCAPDSQLQAAAILGEPVGFGTGGGSHGGHCPGRPLPGNLNRRPQQINLLSVHVLHIVLHNM